MTLLVTGATGFVMSVLGRHWLDAFPGERLVVLDAAPLDAAAQRYFGAVAERLDVVVADVTRPDAWRGALGAGHHPHRPRRHGDAAVARHRGRGAARTGSGESRPDHRRQCHGNGGGARLGAHAAQAAEIHLCQLRRGLQASRSGSSGRAAAGGRLCDAAAAVRHFEAGLGADHRTLRRPVRPVDRLGAPLVGVRHHGPCDGQPQFPACSESHRAPGGGRA